MAAVMLALAAPGASAATLTADYRFQNTRSSSVGSPPDLVDIGPGTNSFQTDTVDGQSQTVLAFPMGNGVSLSPTTGVVPNGTYSIVARFRFDTVSGFRRILDFKNATSDNGLYVESGNLRFFPYAGGSGTPVAANSYVQVALTRDSAGTMVGYVNGVQQFSLSDAANQFGVISSANTLRFFRDDGAEHSAGRAARIRLFDAALTAAEVADLQPPPPPPAPGDLDPSFGAGGKVTTDFTGGHDWASAMVLQPDGKLVAAGRYTQPGMGVGWALARYNPDGSLDQSFGSGGKVTTNFDFPGSEAFAIILQPDGKLVAAGYAHVGVSPIGFALARYNADGSLDAGFGSAGKVTTTFGAGTSTPGARALVLQPDGKLVAAGTVFVNDGSSNNFALIRYNPDGTLDAGFGAGGRVITNFAGSSIDAATALVLQPDGKLVAAGETHSPRHFALARYNPDGSLDTSFGSGGKVTTDVGGSQDSEAFALVLQPDGKLVAAGRSLVGGVTVDFALARYNPDGSLDAGFGAGGKVTTGFVGLLNDEVFALVLQLNGKLVAAGDTRTGSTSDFALARYNTDGSLDTTFGSGGKVITSFAGLSTVFALVAQPDGKLVAAGSGPGVNSDFALARYFGDPVAVPTTSTLTSAPNPSIFGQSVTFTDTVCGGSAGSKPTGTVTFKEGTTELGTGDLSPGGGEGCSQATFATATLSVGSHDITADYPGDDTHAPSTSNTVTQVVNKIPTTSTLTSSPNPSTFGESVTFTDTVCGGPPVPTGTVTFREGATSLGTGDLAPGGDTGCAQATFATASLSVGSHDVTADYPGDTTHAGSTSNTVTQVVNKIPTTSTLASSPNPSTFGESVTFTDTVCGGPPEPTGTVTFREGSSTLGTGTLAPGGGSGCAQATFATDALAVGSHDLTADYPGDATHGPSSDTVTQVVNPVADLSISKADSPDPVNNGQTLTYTLTVQNAGPDPATGVVVTDDLPDSVTFGSASASQGSCTEASGMVSCALGSMASGGTATVTITVTPTAPGTITNTATVFGNETDPDPADNTDTETTTVDPVADLSIAKSCSPDRVVPGKTVRCTLTITNAGPDGAQNVVVTDDLPEVVTVVGTPSGGGFACTTQDPDPEITCTRATLAAGATATITYTVRVSEDLGPEVSFTNTARVTSSTFDPDPTDNTATETTSTPTCTIDRRTAGSPQVIMGTAGNDVICGSAFGDVIRGGGGNDVVFALGGDDIVFGEAGNDSVFGGAGNDTIDGGDGNDSAYGGAGNDTLSGGNGNDTLSGGAGSDTSVGGSGTDSCATEVRSGCES